MADSMIQNLLKTPSQIREEQLQKMRQEAAGRAQLGGPIRGAMSALPGIFSSVLQQQRPALATDIAQTARGLTQGLGGMLSAAGYGQTGQALAQATVTPEERQAAQTQSVMRGVNFNNVESILKAAQKLKEAGNIQGAQALVQMARRAQLSQAQIASEQALEQQRLSAAAQKEAETAKTEQEAQTLASVNNIKSTIPFDPTNIVKYYTDQAQALANAGYPQEAEQAIQNAVNAREDEGSSETAAITNQKYYSSLTDDQKLEFQLANGRVLDPETARQLEAAKSEGRATGKEIATRLMSFDERIATTNQMLSVVEELPTMEGFESAVGLSARLPTIRPSTADFEVKLEQLKGQAFLEQFNKLRGAGAITEKEGTAAAAALTALSSDRALQMSEEQFLKELKTLKDVIQAAQKRAREGTIVENWTPKDSYVPTEDQQPRRRRYNPETQMFEEVTQ